MVVKFRWVFDSVLWGCGGVCQPSQCRPWFLPGCHTVLENSFYQFSCGFPHEPSEPCPSGGWFCPHSPASAWNPSRLAWAPRPTFPAPPSRGHAAHGEGWWEGRACRSVMSWVHFSNTGRGTGAAAMFALSQHQVDCMGRTQREQLLNLPRPPPSAGHVASSVWRTWEDSNGELW